MTTVIETVEAVRGRSGDLLETVQEGVGSLAARLSDLVEPAPPPPRSKKWLWALIIAVLVLVGLAWFARRAQAQRSTPPSDTP